MGQTLSLFLSFFSWTLQNVQSPFFILWSRAYDALSEERTEGILDSAARGHFDGIGMRVDGLEIGGGDEDAVEAELLRFRDALLDTTDRTDFAGETHLATKADVGVDGSVNVGGEDGGDDAEVNGWVGDAQSARDVEEDVFLCKFEAYTFLQYCQQHIQAAVVEAVG